MSVPYSPLRFTVRIDGPAEVIHGTGEQGFVVVDAMQDESAVHARYWFKYRADAETKAREMNEALKS